MVDGLWAQTGDATVSDFATVVWRLRLLGFNSVRLPFSFQEFSKTPRSFVWNWCANDTAKVISSVVPAGTTLPAGATPPPLDVTPARTPMTCNDYVPATSIKARLLWASKFFAVNGFYVVLDDHMIYDTLVLDDPAAWTKAWSSLAADVAADPVLKNRVLFDLLNEPDSRGIAWRSGQGKGGYGMDALYEMAGDAVFAANPTALMLFEGTGQLGEVAMNWGDGFATDPAVVSAGGVQSAQPFFNMVSFFPRFLSLFFFFFRVFLKTFFSPVVSSLLSPFKKKKKTGALQALGLQRADLPAPVPRFGLDAQGGGPGDGQRAVRSPLELVRVPDEEGRLLDAERDAKVQDVPGRLWRDWIQVHRLAGPGDAPGFREIHAERGRDALPDPQHVLVVLERQLGGHR